MGGNSSHHIMDKASDESVSTLQLEMPNELASGDNDKDKHIALGEGKNEQDEISFHGTQNQKPFRRITRDGVDAKRNIIQPSNSPNLVTAKSHEAINNGACELQEERMAETDRDDSESMSKAYCASQKSSEPSYGGSIGDQYIASKKAKSDQHEDDYESRNASPSTSNSDTTDSSDSSKSEGGISKLLKENEVSLETEPCMSCLDDFAISQLVRVPCGDTYCSDCINRVFKRSMIEEPMFPPRCCQIPMTIENVGHFLTEEMIHRYETRSIEVNTVDRVYCSNKNCATFILPVRIAGNVAKCQDCDTLTCSLCGNATHAGDCATDPDLEALLKLGQQQGWKRCPKCGAMIELHSGCNHMTCNCHNQFCYVCSAPWKTCDCPQFQENNLQRRARELWERMQEDGLWEEMNFGPMPQQPGDADMDQMVHLIMNRHECQHENWALRCGAAQCEHCHQMMGQYTWRCRRCMFRVCSDCRDYRL